MPRAVSILVAATLLFAALTGMASGRGDPSPDIYILAGQSNMSGRGALDQLRPEERRPDPAIRVFGNDGRWRVALDPLDSAEGQVDGVSADSQAAVGPGLFFAREMRRLRNRPVLLIPCAKGGSSIGRWRPAEARDTLYGSCLARVREAGGRVAGILWYQGESDADTVVRAQRWASEFEQLIGRFRSDLGGGPLPVAFVQIADPARRADRIAKYPAWETLRQAQQGVALPCAVMVAAGNLPLNDDELHLSTHAQRILGRKLALAMHTIARGNCSR